MEKQIQPDTCSLASTVTASATKDYERPASYICETPPPAYKQPTSASVKITRIVAVTVILVAILLGCFILAAAWIEARASCVRIEVEQKSEEKERDNSVESLPTPAAHIDEDPLLAVESAPAASHVNQLEDAAGDDDVEDAPTRIQLPLHLVFDDLAGEMIEKNQKARMNCVVEKRKAEEIVDHQPKHISLPFGLNLTSDPRYVHFTGEKMAISCASEHDHRRMPQVEQEAAPVVTYRASPRAEAGQPSSQTSHNFRVSARHHTHPPVPHPHMVPPPQSPPSPGPVTQVLPLPQALRGLPLPIPGGSVGHTVIIQQARPRQAHFVHPRSAGVADETHDTKKRTKRYACSCEWDNDEA